MVRIVVIGIDGGNQAGGAGQRVGRGEEISGILVREGRGQRRGRVKRERDEAEENEKADRRQPKPLSR